MIIGKLSSGHNKAPARLHSEHLQGKPKADQTHYEERSWAHYPTSSYGVYRNCWEKNQFSLKYNPW